MTDNIKYEQKTASIVKPAEHVESKTTYNQLNKNMFQFFRDKDYESFETFKEGYNKAISEDYKNIEILCNVNDLIYNYMSNRGMSPEEKQNFKNLTAGIQLLNRSLKQYDINKTDKLFVAMIAGYVLKLVKNFYHD